MSNSDVFRIFLLVIFISNLPVGFSQATSDRFVKCSMRSPEDELLLCHCDAQCNSYADCCYGYTYKPNFTDSSSIDIVMDFSMVSTCEKVAGQRNRISMVNNVSTVVPRLARGSMLCRKPNPNVPMEVLPVNDIGLGVTFGNIHCLQVYRNLAPMEIVKDDSMASWTLKMPSTCYEAIREDLIWSDYNEFLTRALSGNYCDVTLVPPDDDLTRVCFQHDVDGCTYEHSCLKYQSPVETSDGQVYKNIYCATCLNPKQTLSVPEWTPEDDKQTLFTLHRVDPWLWPWDGICRGDGCNPTCRGDDMAFYETCLQPIAEVKGFLHQIDVQIDSNTELSLDQHSDDLKTILTPVISGFYGIYIMTSVKTLHNLTSSCRHFVQISLYLKDSVLYKPYLKMSKQINESLALHKADIEYGIQKVSKYSKKPCISNKPVTRDPGSLGTKGSSQIHDNTNFILFWSIFGVLIFLVGAVTLLKLYTKRLTRDSVSVNGQNNPTVRYTIET